MDAPRALTEGLGGLSAPEDGPRVTRTLTCPLCVCLVLSFAIPFSFALTYVEKLGSQASVRGTARALTAVGWAFSFPLLTSLPSLSPPDLG